MAKYFCKAKCRGDEITPFQILFVESDLPAWKVAYELSKIAKLIFEEEAKKYWRDCDMDLEEGFSGEILSKEKPSYAFKLHDFDSETMELIEEDNYFVMRTFHIHYEYGHWGEKEYRKVIKGKDETQNEVEIIRMDDINFINL